MRRFGRGSLVIAGVLGLGLSSAVRAEDPPENSRGRASSFRSATIWDHLLPSDPKPAPKKDADKDAKPRKADKGDKGKKGDDLDKDAGLKKVAAKPAPQIDEFTAERDREEKAYLRRLGVCLKLHEIAEQTRDDELENKARDLEDRVWAIYAQRTAHLPAGDDADDAKALDKRVGKPSRRGTDKGEALIYPKNKDREGIAVSREGRP